MNDYNEKLAFHANPVVAFLKKPAAEFTKADIVKYICENEIRMVNFMYPGGDGKLKTLNFVLTDLDYLDTILTCGERVDGSSLFSFIQAGSSDLYVLPRFRTAFREFISYSLRPLRLKAFRATEQPALRFFVQPFQCKRIDVMNIVLLPRVDRTPEYSPRGQSPAGKAAKLLFQYGPPFRFGQPDRAGRPRPALDGLSWRQACSTLMTPIRKKKRSARVPKKVA